MQLIPEDFEYSSMNGDAFVSQDATSQIKEGSEVRIRIVGVRADPQDMVSAGFGGYWSTMCMMTAAAIAECAAQS
jgi:DNA-directed RNA polymerase subunit E'/Rpb7